MGANVEGCKLPGGDGGIFQALPRARGGTCTSYPKPEPYLIANGSNQNFGATSAALSCIAALGTGGCGYEHQIASVWKALGGDVDGVPMRNQGFLRDDALLAIVLITDEDDSSAPADTDSVPTRPEVLG